MHRLYFQHNLKLWLRLTPGCNFFLIYSAFPVLDFAGQKLMKNVTIYITTNVKKASYWILQQEWTNVPWPPYRSSRHGFTGNRLDGVWLDWRWTASGNAGRRKDGATLPCGDGRKLFTSVIWSDWIGNRASGEPFAGQSISMAQTLGCEVGMHLAAKAEW